MKSYIQPYVFFGGRCEEAVEYYQKHLGAEVQMTVRFKDAPEPPPPGMLPEGWEAKIMHTAFRIGETVILASDGCDKPGFEGFCLSLMVGTEAEADKIFAALADGGTVRMPLAKTFWSPYFGSVKDKFGLAWMVQLPSA